MSCTQLLSNQRSNSGYQRSRPVLRRVIITWIDQNGKQRLAAGNIHAVHINAEQNSFKLTVAQWFQKKKNRCHYNCFQRTS